MTLPPTAEERALVEAGPRAVRAAARQLALAARPVLGRAERLLRNGGQHDAADAARAAVEAATALVAATHDGDPQVFACRR